MARARLIAQFMALIMPPVEATNAKVHKGTVVSVAPIDLRVGLTVITPDGIGEIKSIIPDWESKKPKEVEVYLYRGYIKRHKVLNLQQYVVYHTPTGQFIKLSPANYRYIYLHQQSVSYRVTNRLYAQLTEECKVEYAYVKTLHKQRGGLHCLKTLAKQNLEIKRKG